MPDGTLSTNMYDKRDANFPYICYNIPESPAYGVYISQRYIRVCSSYGGYIGGGGYSLKSLLIKVIMLQYLRSTFESCMVDTMLYYNITILPFHVILMSNDHAIK